MQFLSDNGAAVHPAVWQAMRDNDAPDAPYDGDRLSCSLDEAFSGLFAQPCAAFWVASGTAANCLALSAMVPPHGAVICNKDAHIETDEGGAPGFFLHGAKLMLAAGEGARLAPEAIDAIMAPLGRGVHQVRPHAVSITQATEYGRVYRPDELQAIAQATQSYGLGLHVDGARFANAVAFLGCAPYDACAGAQALSFGFVKNGGMSAEAIIVFDLALADVLRFRRKRAGHLQSKGRFLAAQIHALLEHDLWLGNARAANAAAVEIGAGAGARLRHPVEANEVFLRLSTAERAALRVQGFAFYDWDDELARFVTPWDVRMESVMKLVRALAAL